jgi:hypothetical protein
LPGGIHAIATGMNYFVMNRMNLIHAEWQYKNNVKRLVDEFVFRRRFMQEKWQRAADRALSLYEFLKKNVHNG